VIPVDLVPKLTGGDIRHLDVYVGISDSKKARMGQPRIRRASAVAI
jgi:hypothetical protein